MTPIKALLFFCLLVPGAAFGQDAGALTERNSRYRIQPGDSIEVQYRYTPEYTQTVSIQPDGFASLALIGDIKLVGMTVEQAREIIANKSAARLRHPEVSVTLHDYEKPHFTVLGEVGAQGRFDLRGNVSAVDAIAMAGGFKPSAKHSQVILVHRLDSDTGEARLLDFKALVRTPNQAREFPKLRDGDLLIVPQNLISKIERIVKLANLGVYYNPAGL